MFIEPLHEPLVIPKGTHRSSSGNTAGNATGLIHVLTIYYVLATVEGSFR